MESFPRMVKPSLELKGSSFTLSVLHINSNDLNDIAQELESKIAQAPNFFYGAPLVVNLNVIDDVSFDLAGLKKILTNHNLVFVGITGAKSNQKKLAKELGLAQLISGKQTRQAPTNPKMTKIMKQNIRSGQQIYAKNSDLIIFGAVSNGAEVIADGSIHVYGALRGKAMAGANGDKHAVIIAQSMEAELISIAGQYWLTENLQQHSATQNTCIRLDNESLVVESLPH